MKFQFASFSDFLSMHGHGPYVWAAYAISILALVYLLLAPVWAKRAFFKQQRRLQKLARQQTNDI